MADKLPLFRGIAIPAATADRMREDILRKGTRGDEGKQWQFTLNDLRPNLERLLEKPNLSLDDTRPPEGRGEYFPAVCACGDEVGASYYAIRHNTHPNLKEKSYLIHFSVESPRVYVDGRDFLYTCFQLWDRDSRTFLTAQRRVLIQAFW